MKILVYTDVHWSTYSSIVRKRGNKYSVRLEKLIQSLNWAEQLAVNSNCDFTICAGDFFDTNNLSAEEISALNEVVWNGQPHYFLVGNHEMATSDLTISSAHLFNLINNIKVITKPESFSLDTNIDLLFLPYILESNRQALDTYFNINKNKKTIIISHNDIQGVQMGQFISKFGFSIDEIEQNCNLFLNGHIHNGEQITKKIINIGSLSAQNFSNDSLKYIYGAIILDTDTFTIDVFENPYSLNFYKFNSFLEFKTNYNRLKDNAVITIKCDADEANECRTLIAECSKIIEYRLILNFNSATTINTTEIEMDLSVNHIAEFKKFIIDTLGTSELVESELEAVCKL